MSITVTPQTLGFIVSFPPAAESDVEGYVIHAMPTAICGGDFTPSADNLIYKGPNTYFRYTVTTRGEWIVYAAAYDTFGDTGLNYGAKHSVTPSIDPSETIKLLNGDINQDKLAQYLLGNGSFTDLIETTNFAAYEGSFEMGVSGTIPETLFSISRHVVIQAGETAGQHTKLEMLKDRASLQLNSNGSVSGMAIGWASTPFNPLSTYVKTDTVSVVSGDVYEAITSVPAGMTPPNIAYWEKVKGDVSEVVFIADKFKICLPDSENPGSPDRKITNVFTVGKIQGSSDNLVGINGNLVVDGTIKANAIDLTTLRVGSGAPGTGTIAMGEGAVISWSHFDTTAQNALLAGATRYTWIKYADSADGVTNFSDQPATAGVYRTYIGFKYNNVSSTELNDPSLYTWSLIAGQAGSIGKDGKTTEIQYSINGVTSWHATFATGADIYMRIRTGNDTVGWSAWSDAMKIIGDNGQAGADAVLPSIFDAPSGSGMFINDTHMGYYNAGAWKSYLDQYGNFVLGDAISNPTTGKGVYWDQTNGQLKVMGEIHATSGTFSGLLTSSATIQGGTFQTAGLGSARVVISSATSRMSFMDSLNSERVSIGLSNIGQTYADYSYLLVNSDHIGVPAAYFKGGPVITEEGLVAYAGTSYSTFTVYSRPDGSHLQFNAVGTGVPATTYPMQGMLRATATGLYYHNGTSWVKIA